MTNLIIGIVFLLSIVLIKGNEIPVAHLLPHSHCDPGWIKTVDEYYNDQVQYILNNVISELENNKNYRFVWSEVVYLKKWYEAASQSDQKKLQGLVELGQFEFVGGGWVMNDETSPTYTQIIDQMSLGHQWLMKTFKKGPTSGYQIDTVASSSFPVLLSQMGLKYHIINRIDDRLKYQFQSIPDSGKYPKDKLFEFYWQGSTSLPNDRVFTHIYDHHYSPPEYEENGKEYGFDFENGGEKNPPITKDNIEDRCMQFADYVKRVVKGYRTKHLLVPMGNDFSYVNSRIWFENMDKMIEEINNHPEKYGIKMVYSTLESYFKSVTDYIDKLRIPIPVKTAMDDDYVSYTNCWASELDKFDDCIAYWSGYYTTYPGFKLMTREVEALLRTSQNIFVIAKSQRGLESEIDFINWKPIYESIQNLRQQLALTMHHDAITGTSKPHVMKDYLNRIDTARKSVIELMSSLFESSIALSTAANGDLQYMKPIEADQLPNSIGETVIIPVLLYNNLAWSRKEFVNITLPQDFMSNYKLSIDSIEENEHIVDTPFEMIQDRVWWYSNMLPLGYRTYFFIITKIEPQRLKISPKNLKETVSLSNKYISANFKLIDGIYQLQSIENKRKGLIHPIKQSIQYYTSYGDGAYIFRPTNASEPIEIQDPEVIVVKDSGNIQRIVQRVQPHITVTWTVYSSSSDPALGNFLEHEVSAITPDNKEMISRFDSPSMNDQGQFFTDSHNFNIVKRMRGKKFNDKHNFTIISGNYYPMSSTAYIHSETEQNQLTLLSRQAHGVSSQSKGSLEIMLNRNTLTDDMRGLNDNVNCTWNINSVFRIMFSSIEESNSLRPQISYRLNYPIVHFLNSHRPSSVLEYMKIYSILGTSLGGTGLPLNIHMELLPLSDDGFNTVLMRLYHIYTIDQSLFYSDDVNIMVNSIFDNHEMTSMKKKSLTLLSTLSEYSERIQELMITANPRSIHTFTFTLKELQDVSWWNWISFLAGLCFVPIAICSLFCCAVGIKVIFTQKRHIPNWMANFEMKKRQSIEDSDERMYLIR